MTEDLQYNLNLLTTFQAKILPKMHLIDPIEIDLSGCSKVTRPIMIEMISRCSRLQRLSMAKCSSKLLKTNRGASLNFSVIAKQLASLKFLNLLGTYI
jgi:hypothetical protein